MISYWLAEDESLFQAKLSIICKKLGINLSKKFFKGEDLTSGLQKEGPTDIILLDLNLVGSTLRGPDLIKKCIEVSPNSLVGMITTSSDTSEIEQMKQAGAMFYIVKSGVELENRMKSFDTDVKAGKIKKGAFTLYG
jgi:DNA-binding NarL/FixJ family response regulator